jgi:hypothetical protein
MAIVEGSDVNEVETLGSTARRQKINPWII